MLLIYLVHWYRSVPTRVWAALIRKASRRCLKGCEDGAKKHRKEAKCNMLDSSSETTDTMKNDCVAEAESQDIKSVFAEGPVRTADAAAADLVMYDTKYSDEKKTEFSIIEGLQRLKADALERIKAALEARINAERLKLAEDSRLKVSATAEDVAARFQAVARGRKAPSGSGQGVERCLREQTIIKELAATKIQAVARGRAGRSKISSTNNTMNLLNEVSPSEAPKMTLQRDTSWRTNRHPSFRLNEVSPSQMSKSLTRATGSTCTTAIFKEDLVATKLQASFRGGVERNELSSTSVVAKPMTNISMADAKAFVYASTVTNEDLGAAVNTSARATAVISQGLAATKIQASFRRWAVRNKRSHASKIWPTEERTKSRSVLKRRPIIVPKIPGLSSIREKMQVVAQLCTPRSPPPKPVSPPSPPPEPEPVNLVSGDVNRILMTQALADLLRDYLPLNLRISGVVDWVLRYSPKVHGVSMSTLYRNVSDCSKTVLVIQDAQQHVFGGFATASWEPGTAFCGSGEAFVFSVGSDDVSRTQIYPWTCQNNFIMYADPRFMAMGGGDSGHALLLREDLLNGHSFPTPTFGNPTLASSNEFVVRDLEIWSLEEHDK